MTKWIQDADCFGVCPTHLTSSEFQWLTVGQAHGELQGVELVAYFRLFRLVLRGRPRPTRTASSTVNGRSDSSGPWTKEKNCSLSACPCSINGPLCLVCCFLFLQLLTQRVRPASPSSDQQADPTRHGAAAAGLNSSYGRMGCYVSCGGGGGRNQQLVISGTKPDSFGSQPLDHHVSLWRWSAC